MRRKKGISHGATGFFLRGDHELKVRVVNGVMRPLLSANRGDILTAIYSLPLISGICISAMYGRNDQLVAAVRRCKGKSPLGVIGRRARLSRPGWGLNTTYPLHQRRKGQVDMWRNIYLSKRHSRLIGRKDGSGLGTLKTSPAYQR